jgi:CBS domain containing-hemolysin-like protein
MVPLISVVALPCGTSLADAARRMTETGHSRLPVYRDRIDQIVGIIIHQDLLGATDWAAPVEAVCRPAFFVPETKRVDELLAEMRSRRQRIAVAVDEYGGAVGIITAEDLLEEIVGDIHDETDRSGAMVRRTGERTWLASGRAEGEHLEAAAGLLLPEGQYETLAGFLLARLGRIPQVGDGLTVEPFRLSVTKASDRAILEVLIERRAG